MTSIPSMFGASPSGSPGGLFNGGRVFSLLGERLSDVAQRTGHDLADLLHANPQFAEDQALLAGEPIQLPERADAPDRPVLLAANSLYKHTDANGRVTYSDVPPAQPGATEVLRADGTKQQADKQIPQPVSASTLIKAAQKHGGKLDDYLQQIDYLRTHDPKKLDAVLKELQETDPKLWAELQKYPQFRPLADSLSFEKNSARHLEAVAEGVKTAVTKGIQDVPVAVASKVGEGTVKDLMKRDRHPSTVDVLGSKASTLPEPPKPTYSNTKLGEWRKAEDGKLAKAGKDAAKDLAGAEQATRAASAAALSRVLGPILDVEMTALQTDVMAGVAYFKGLQIAQKLEAKGALNGDPVEFARALARFDFDAARAMINTDKLQPQAN